ncbi:MAG: hypothetical protein IKW90_02180 [Lachnospiraceae bacterium]|nr:hypothetical protein [Lachnospiraceae bacterium]
MKETFESYCKNNGMEYLIDEWNFEKNASLGMYPANIAPKSNKKAWWKCRNCGNTWDSVISSRTGQSQCGCPYCSNEKLLSGFNDLATKCPELLDEWLYEKNDANGIFPDKILPGTDKKVWWKCKLGHTWEAQVNTRVNGCGCPYCSNPPKRIFSGFNDLATKCPTIAKEWDNEKNKIKPTDIGIGYSQEKVWWRCPFGHSYQATVYSRTGKNHNGCPICSKEKHSSFSEQALYYYVKKYFPDAINSDRETVGMELDIYIPSVRTAVEYDGNKWHLNSTTEEKKNEVCKKAGIVLIRVREEGLKLYDNCIGIVRYGHKNVNELSSAIKRVLIQIDKSREYNIDAERDAIEIYSQYILTRKQQSLQNKYPEIAKEWHPTLNGTLTPQMVSPGAEKKVWWLCYNGHSYRAVIYRRTSKSSCGCPYCSVPAKKLLKGFNDLSTKYPEVAKEWHPTKNGDLSPDGFLPGSHQKVWWKCCKGHEWQAEIKSRATRNDAVGCPKCARESARNRTRASTGENDLLTLFPELCKEWDYEKNQEIGLYPERMKPGSNKKAWWKCSRCGGSWDAVIHTRTKLNAGCPYCGKNPLRVQCGVNDLATRCPEIAVEWHPIKNGSVTPDKVYCTSNKKAWWKCRVCGHEWETVISVRTRMGCGCPKCKRKRNNGKLE